MVNATSILKKMQPQKTAIRIVYPPEKVFRGGNEELKRTLGPQTLFSYEDYKLDDHKGICLKYQGVDRLAKGFPFPEAIRAIGVAKAGAMVLLRNINWLKLLRKKSRLNLLIGFCKMADNSLSGYYLQDEFLCPFARESKKFLNIFFEKLNIPVQLADIFAFFMQYDDNYRYRLQDLMNETDKECFKSPIKEIKRLLRLSLSRDITNTISSKKFALIVNILTISLCIPKVRRAFKEALDSTNFDNLKMDDDDRYFCLMRGDYDYFGRPIEDREEEFYKLTPVSPKQLIL